MFQSLHGFSAFCNTRGSSSWASAEICFNPFVGFLPAATRETDDWSYWDDALQSLLGLLPSATRSCSVTPTMLDMFQSLRGFSAFCDSM